MNLLLMGKHNPYNRSKEEWIEDTEQKIIQLING